jgi:hypothetical protein
MILQECNIIRSFFTFSGICANNVRKLGKLWVLVDTFVNLFLFFLYVL